MRLLCRFELSGAVKRAKFQIDLTREDGDTHQTSVIRVIQDDLPETNDKYCQSCTTSSSSSSRYSHSHAVTCTCNEDHQEAEDAVRMMSITHFQRLNAGDSVYLKDVSGGIWVGGTSQFIFSGEYITE